MTSDSSPTAVTPTARVLLLAHVFPRAVADPMGTFLLHLAEALAERGTITEVIAPHAATLADCETLGAVRVQRFHYAPARWERLAYTGTMHEIVGRGLGGKVLFAFFCAAFLLKALAVARSDSHAAGLKNPGPSAPRPLIHAHWWLPGGIVGAIASVLTRTPLVITTHGTDVELLRRTRAARPIARFAFSRARAITCGSTYLRDQLLALGVAEPARVRVIPMPVSGEFENRNSVPRSENSRTELLCVARLTAQKSIDTLVDALALLRDRGSPARLTIIGDGPARAALEEQTRRLNLQDRVQFLGSLPQRDLPPHYAQCGVFVLPSVREGMGLVLAEALLCGAPVIAANSGGVTDIVKDGETGLLVPERDARALAAAIEQLLSDPGLAERLAANGATWVRKRYTREPVAEQFEQIYNSVLGSTALPTTNPTGAI